jgi:hypothetical protein
MKKNGTIGVFAASFLSVGSASFADDAPPPVPAQPDLQAITLKLQQDVAELRGLAFRHSVPAEMQSQEDFAKYMDERMRESLPEALNANYGAIVKRLGLYRGPLSNLKDVAKMVMGSQLAAYYDPKSQRFYVLLPNMPEMLRNMTYAHELYHGLQDQYFDLQKYMPMKADQSGPALDSDEMSARQAVVEGDASYIMTLWMVKQMAHETPSRDMLKPVIAMQSQMDMNQLKAMMKLPNVAETLGTDTANALDASDKIPSFIMESMLGVYLKGMNFVFSVQEQGWSEVEKLYTDYPPQSTEQILHPEKWRSREAPSRIEFPSFERVKVLDGWELLNSDVVGEFGWRIIFKEQGLASDAEAAAAGWDGDRYAVFKREDSEETMMIVRTSWDSKAQAGEFAEDYRRLLEKKYADTHEPFRLVQKGADVFIVEGGDAKDLNALLKLVQKSKKKKA